MGVTSRSTSGRTSTNSNSRILKMKQVLYAAVIIAFFATSAMANTKCYSCMKLDEATNITRPWKCGQDGATQVEETCGDRVIGCVSEHVKHRRGGGRVQDEALPGPPEAETPRVGGRRAGLGAGPQIYGQVRHYHGQRLHGILHRGGRKWKRRQRDRHLLLRRGPLQQEQLRLHCRQR